MRLDHGRCGWLTPIMASRDTSREPLLAPSVCAGRALRQHEIAHVGGGIMHPHRDAVRDLGPELAENRSRFAHHARSVGAALVPVRRQPQEPARVTGAQRADDHIVRIGSVLDHHQLVGSAIETGGDASLAAVLKQQFPVLGIDPRLGDNARALRRAAAVHVLDLLVHVIGGENALVDQEFAQADLHRPVVGERIVEIGARRIAMRGRSPVRMAFVMIMVVSGHGDGSSQC